MSINSYLKRNTKNFVRVSKVFAWPLRLIKLLNKPWPRMEHKSSSVNLATPERNRSGRDDSFCFEPKRKKVRRSSLAWKGYKESDSKELDTKDHGSNKERSLCYSVSPFSEVEVDLISKNEKLDIKLQEVGGLDILANSKAAIDFSINKEKGAKEYTESPDAHKKKCTAKSFEPSMNCTSMLANTSFARSQGMVDNILFPVSIIPGKTSEDRKATYDAPLQSSGSPERPSSKQESTHVFEEESAEKGCSELKKDYGTPSMSLNFCYRKNSLPSSLQDLEMKDLRKENFPDVQHRVKASEQFFKDVEKIISVKDMKIAYLEEKVREAEASSVEKSKQMSSLKETNRMLEQKLSLMSEKYRSGQSSLENVDQEEKIKLVERVTSLLDQMKSLYEEEEYIMKLKSDGLSKQNEALEAEVEGYKKIVRELVKRIRNEKSATELVHSIKKDIS